MKMCEQILKKKTAPQYNSNSLNCKNQEHRNIASLSLQLRSYNKLLMLMLIVPTLLRGEELYTKMVFLFSQF